MKRLIFRILVGTPFAIMSALFFHGAWRCAHAGLWYMMVGGIGSGLCMIVAAYSFTIMWKPIRNEGDDE